MPHYKLVIIDFDGTICCSQRAIAHTLACTFDFFKLPIPTAANIQYTISCGLGLQETFIALNSSLAKLDHVDMQEWIKTYRELYLQQGLDKTELFPGADLALHALANAGIATVILSNKGETAVKAALSHFHLIDYTTLVIGSRPGIAAKPDRMVFDAIIQPHFPYLTCPDILVIGDTAADLKFATNIGVDACWVSYGYGSAVECQQLQPKFTLDALQYLPQHIGLTQ